MELMRWARAGGIRTRDGYHAVVRPRSDDNQVKWAWPHPATRECVRVMTTDRIPVGCVVASPVCI